MPRPIPEELIEEVRTHFDIVDWVGRYVHLKKGGRNFFGLCPFHSEKTPSFSVSPDKQIFHCFGCGKGGDLFTFVQEIEGLSFIESVQFLAKEAGISLPVSEQEVSQTTDEKQLLFKAYEWTALAYRHLLNHPSHGLRARQYLAERGIQRETTALFGLGYAPPNRDLMARSLKKKGYSPALMVKGGLLSERIGNNSYYDKFRDRLIFPIHDLQGRVIAFGGRRLTDQAQGPKYLNSPESLLFDKSRTLFNFHRARRAIRQKNEAIIMEGYLDVIMAVQNGVENVVATLGTSLTEEHARILRRNAENVILCYDADQAGQNASLRGIEALRQVGCTVKVAQMPAGWDPDDFLRKKGKEAFLYQVMAEALPVIQFRLKQMRSRFDMTDGESRLKYVHAALEVITDLPNAIERDHYLRDLAGEFDLSLDALKEDQRRLYFQRKKRSGSEGQPDNTGKMWHNNAGKQLAEAKPMPAYYVAERMLLAWMIRDKGVTQTVEQHIGSQFNVEEHAVLAAYLYAYYTEHQEIDINEFLHTLTDVQLIELASGLMMMELDCELSPAVLSDYIKRVLDYPLWLEIETMKEEMHKAERIGDRKRALDIALKMNEIRRVIQLVPVHVRSS